ncbi:DeoR/GlpR family DNA-binding transcription regulator [Natroniella acetigena]|uniref:DeoR/GlpR family DNA-binding transcription regulator n=1 Tax=Natroniella acetigena TaxID=52004 RepID=UPI002009DF2D|nr:DeoR/GlpR family DNA-binding transcription regulator [Natroniella acetigena]MCK8828287.1 DeoR/GlpR family DNA-binding transcription regulator [Natroniella acetigena]
MFAEERRTEIIGLTKEGKSVTVNDLCDKFDVSASTIRRDLQLLEKEGLLERTHGGAVAKGGAKFEPSFIEKETENIESKLAIGQQAAELISDGDTIIIDAGTTTTKLIDHLDNYLNLTIITNAVNVAVKLAKSSHEIILTGGNLKKKTLAMVGPCAEINLKRFNVDKVFLGTNSIDLEQGITTPDLVEANVKSLMVEVAQEVIVLADHTKFKEVAFINVVGLAEVDKIITDQKLEKEILKEYKQQVEIIVS